MRYLHQYWSPDDFYEATVSKLVTPGCKWADVGCGRDLFPSNRGLAERLSKRAGLVFGIDPDPNVLENAYVHERSQTKIEGCRTHHQFDILTLRMVAEHIADPDGAMAKIATLLKPGGLLVIYTPYKWAPMSLVASLVPFRWHNPLKRLIWGTQPRDTFRTVYALNTRKDLRRHTEEHGLHEVAFKRVDDCRITEAFRVLQWLELNLRKFLRLFGIPYWESCLLAVYRRG
jgi:2-polyprenyl-3-methyl-5-hydroxy-6-metoxy-1,4-benzoquinol methylase